MNVTIRARAREEEPVLSLREIFTKKQPNVRITYTPKQETFSNSWIGDWMDRGKSKKSDQFHTRAS